MRSTRSKTEGRYPVNVHSEFARDESNDQSGSTLQGKAMLFLLSLRTWCHLEGRLDALHQSDGM